VQLNFRRERGGLTGELRGKKKSRRARDGQPRVLFHIQKKRQPRSAAANGTLPRSRQRIRDSTLDISLRRARLGSSGEDDKICSLARSGQREKNQTFSLGKEQRGWKESRGRSSFINIARH